MSIRAATPPLSSSRAWADHVAIARDDVIDAQVHQVALVLRKAGGDDVGSCAPRQLDREAPDAAGGADDQDGLALLQLERVDRRHRRQAGDGRRPGGGEVHFRRLRGSACPRRDESELGPGAVVNVRVRRRDEIRRPRRPSKASTPAPTSSTTPAKSRPRMTGNPYSAYPHRCRRTIALSTGFTDEAVDPDGRAGRRPARVPGGRRGGAAQCRSPRGRKPSSRRSLHTQVSA